jgi:hypothetical protein
LLHKVATGKVRPLRESGPIADVIMRLLSREPEDRPSAPQARDALAALAAGRDSGLAPITPTVVAGAAPIVPPAPPGPQTLSELPRPEPKRSRNRRLPVLLAVLAVLAAGAGVAAALLTGDAGGSEPSTPVAQPGTTAPAVPGGPSGNAGPTTSQQALPPAPTTTAPPPTTEPPRTSQPNEQGAPAADAVGFVEKYYGLLPGNTDAAWQMLSAQAQSRSGGGRGSYDSFWSEVESVNLRDVRQTDANTVEATVVFERRDGTTTNEPYRFVVGTGPDGHMIMQSFSQL